MRFDVDYNKAPLLVIWEVTRACQLACKHCRASAINVRDPNELTLEQGRELLADIAAMGTPLVIFTGGDPLQRDDLEELIVSAKELGLRAGSIPAATEYLTQKRVQSLAAAGLDQMALSLDGPTSEQHDTFRGVEGSFKKVMQGALWAREARLPLQINTVFAAWNFGEFDRIAALVESLGIVFWEVFFLVPTGRGEAMKSCTADQYEVLFGKLHEMSQRVSFIIKVTEAQHYRRYVMQHSVSRTEGEGDQVEAQGAIRSAPKPVNAGKGFCFVDHVGNVCPSGFLPVIAGNVKDSSISDVYRESDIFRELRDYSKLKGKCGRCEFREVCGGSRSRAHAMTGDIHAEEPFCVYEPATTLNIEHPTSNFE
ncbi:MAG: TIGR04053 family radical SAM/SPASM domain-containing protein [Verrucomicrobia bacterium]|nr:TIGR04053 family radical SAM/SPASM domain-containing protein [Verrucomicrobiota bacterium]